jgi:general secretion pathway protein G
MKDMKKMKSVTRRFVTLIEMMIVMFLIALITGVVAYNYRGTLEEGKAFKTKQGIEKIQNVLSLAMADNPNLDLSDGSWQKYLEGSPLVQNPKSVQFDGWGNKYEVGFDTETNTIKVISRKYIEYQNKNQNSMFKEEAK